MTKHELHDGDKVVTLLIAQGQSPYQICTNHPELGLSVRTMYSYIDQGLLTPRSIDLKRKVKFRARRIHKTQITNRAAFYGRTYECVNLIVNHINSTPRESLNGRTPYSVALEFRISI